MKVKLFTSAYNEFYVCDFYQTENEFWKRFRSCKEHDDFFQISECCWIDPAKVESIFFLEGGK